MSHRLITKNCILRPMLFITDISNLFHLKMCSRIISYIGAKVNTKRKVNCDIPRIKSYFVAYFQNKLYALFCYYNMKPSYDVITCIT